MTEKPDRYWITCRVCGRLSKRRVPLSVAQTAGLAHLIQHIMLGTWADHVLDITRR